MAMPASEQCLAAFCVLLALGTSEAAAQANCAAMRRIDIGISVAPPNVVHTSPYVALELGYFTKHCIDARIVQFDGGESPAARACSRFGAWRRACRRLTWWPKASRPRPTSKVSD